ncbi:beta-galactosidase [Sediminibacillus halophilus]|uniref:Beta-galactosidase n=1 Tax=Sediminibacillus halophilus TaxID=482461 RepID=A0A1G9V050_9BACI|nr:beta-galactosidase [Sediminibacillus halophilus]SDM65275.1 beta-galactosidase [Sediminibacillus halophilus]
MIEVKDEKMIIDGEEVILFGGELHYFRVPKPEWRNRIRQAKEAGLNMISTYIPWGIHEYEEGKIDFSGTSREELDLISFLKIVKEEEMFCLVRPGPYVMAEVIDHGIPTWFIDRYPDAMAKTEEGNIHPTRVVSYMHPTYLAKVQNWYKHICPIIERFQWHHGGPIIMFQLDNEVGMFHWVTNQGDFNSVTLDLFTNYLENKYTLSAFKETFHVEDDRIADFVKTKVRQPQPHYGVALKNELSLFMRAHYRQYIEHLKKLADSEGIQVPYVINIHGFDTVDHLKRGTKYPIGLSQLVEVAKIDGVMAAGDYYIGNIEYDNFVDIVLANAFTKSIQWKEQPLFSAEFQGGSIPDRPRLQPSTFDLTTRLCIANGMNAANYYMFVGGENFGGIGILGRRHEWQAPLTMMGEKRAHYHVIEHLGRMLQVYQQPLASSKPDIHTHLAFYPDYFMTEFSNQFTAEWDESLQQEREANLFNGLAKGLRVNNIVYDGFNLLKDGNINVAEIPSLWVFAHERMDGKVQSKLMDYIEAGGNLVLFPVIPTKDMNGDPCTVLKDYMDVDVKGTEAGGFVQVDDVDNVKIDRMEMYDIQEGAFAWAENEEKSVVAFEKRLGKGKLVMFGISMELDYQYKKEVYKNLAAKIDVKSRFHVESEVDVSARINGRDGMFVFLNNFDEYDKDTTVVYQDNQLFDGKAITIPGKSGLLLPINVQLREDLSIRYGTAEIVELTESDQKLSMVIRRRQSEDEIMLHSKNWRPKQSGNIQVVDMRAEEYHVLIDSPEEYETIEFLPV